MFSIVIYFHLVTCSSDHSILFPLDSRRTTAVIWWWWWWWWRHRCANTSTIRFPFDVKIITIASRYGCAVPFNENKSNDRYSHFAKKKYFVYIQMEFCTPSDSLSFCFAYITYFRSMNFYCFYVAVVAITQILKLCRKTDTLTHSFS